jgi:glutamine amidotransferase
VELVAGVTHIIDYGMGNLRSVQKAFEHLGVAATICSTPEEARGAQRLVLPGVGAFRDAISELQRRDFSGLIKDHIESGRPFLGICLGLQLLFDVSYEDGQYEGLGILPGEVVRFPSTPGLKVPHMGWNMLVPQQSNPLTDSLPAVPSVYFVHSYYVAPKDPSVIATLTEHGRPFTSMIARDNVYAVQFHPEKSQSTGLKLLESFAKLAV